jgi:ubiquinone/menaquinone biosynthesis C-methylase UbiE
MYNFNKIQFKKEKFLSPGEEQIYIEGNTEGFETVKNKYIWLAEHTNYGSSNHAKKNLNAIIQFIKQNSLTSALDIGTGRGYFCNTLKECCNTVYGLDFAIKPAKDVNKDVVFINSDAHTIPLSDKSVDLITSFDFLEHVHPDYLEKTIKEMFRVGSKYMIHKIAGGPSSSHHDKLGQLHLIQEGKAFWLNEVFKPHAKQVEILVDSSKPTIIDKGIVLITI